ncbi:MAG: glycosyltransferase family 2 protein, partial [Chlorobium sp.]|nr:glycosyltransferase family 2 protein [Chlorobium sp.]
MPDGPLLTIAMPVFNGGPHLRMAVLSIVQQSFTDWELLLIDDGSTDGAIEELADLADSRIHVIRDGRNRGLAARLNEALGLARGYYFARMDADDISYPERFSQQLAFLKSDQSVDLLGSR